LLNLSLSSPTKFKFIITFRLFYLDLIKIRLILFISHYLGLFFHAPEKKEYYRKYISLLFEALSLKSENEKAICLQSLECLQNIFDDENLKNRNQILLQDLIIRLIPLIPEIQYIQFFDLLQDIIK